jgi:hypothetical protein
MNTQKCKSLLKLLMPLLLLTSLFVRPVIASTFEKLQVEVQLAGVDNSPYLDIRIINLDQQAISLYRNSLPWVDRPGVLKIKAIVVKEGFQEMEEIGRVFNYFGTVSLSPGEAVEGRVRLSARLVNFASVHLQSEIVLLWSYQPRSPAASSFPSFSGAIIVPRASQPRERE